MANAPQKPPPKPKPPPKSIAEALYPYLPSSNSPPPQGKPKP